MANRVNSSRDVISAVRKYVWLVMGKGLGNPRGTRVRVRRVRVRVQILRPSANPYPL
jgi:hypothetical protein